VRHLFAKKPLYFFQMNPPSILTVSRNSRRAVPKPRPLPLSSPPSPPPGRAFQRPRATVVMPSLNPDPCPCRPRHRPIAAAHASPSVVPRHRPCATAATPSRPRPLHLSSPPSATPASRNIRRTCQARPRARGIRARLLWEAPSHPNLPLP
jgi:hypothetical protein